MRRACRALALAAAILSAPAAAEDAGPRRAGLIAAEDPVGLEAGVAELRAEAEADGTARAFWDAFRATFRTSSPDTLRRVSHWRQEAPDSAHAKLAEAIARLHPARLASRVPPPPPGNLSEDPRASRHRARAATLTIQAVEADPGIFLVYGQALALQRAGELPWAPGPVIEALIARDPSRAAIRDAFAAYADDPPVPHRPAAVEGLIRLCGAVAPRVPGYDVETCAAEAVLFSGVGGPFGAAAREVASSSDDRAFDLGRYRELIWAEPGSLAAADRDFVLAYHRGPRFAEASPVAWFREARTLARRHAGEDYLAEAAARAEAARAVWLEKDPLDGEVALQHVELALAEPERPGQPSERQALRQVWLHAMVFGRNDTLLWVAGARLAESPEEAAARLGNAIATASNSAVSVAIAMDTLTGMEEATSAAGLEANGFLCPMARLARLLDAHCRIDPAAQSYCAGHPPYRRVPDLLAALATGDTCPVVAAIPDSELGFPKLVPVPELETFLAAFDPVFD